jgi:hypothetical protein
MHAAVRADLVVVKEPEPAVLVVIRPQHDALVPG